MGAGTRLLATFLVGGILGGCTLAEFSSINRDFNITNNPSKLIDAKQRTILVSNHLDPSGNTKPIVCAEPSPDALTVLAAGFAAQGQASSGDGGSLAASIAESGGSIGLRTQSIQLLRDGFYRLCESYLSGAISAEEYDIVQRRYQANMIGILAIEQLTGTVRPPAVTLGSKASADAGTNLAGLRQLRTDATKKIEQIDKDIQTIKDDKTINEDDKKTKIETLEENKKLLQEDVKAYDVAIEKARSAVSTASADGQFETIAVDSSRFQGENVEHVANAVESIAKTILRSDYSPQLCFSWFRELEGEGQKSKATASTINAPPTVAPPGNSALTPFPVIRDLRDYCSAVFSSAIASQNAGTILKKERAKALAAAADAARQLAVSNKLEKDDLQALLDQLADAAEPPMGENVGGPVLLEIGPELE